MTLSPELRSKINKYNGAKGGSYERHVAKVISAYHGFDWNDAFMRTKRTTGGQPKGDVFPIGDMYGIWKNAGLGAIECKNRNTEWSFDEIYKRCDTCHLFKYWEKSLEDTKDINTVVCFTKNGVGDYILLLHNGTVEEKFPALYFAASEYSFKIMMLQHFLQWKWPRD
jgi:hypothetical protein